MTCPTCNNIGRPTGCLFCGKYGTPPKKIKRKKPNPQLEYIRDQIRIAKQKGYAKDIIDGLNVLLVEAVGSSNENNNRTARRQEKIRQIEELWEQANIDQWTGNRRAYLELITKIKQKENLYFTSQD